MHKHIFLTLCLVVSTQTVSMDHSKQQPDSTQKTTQTKSLEKPQPNSCPYDKCDLCNLGISFDSTNGTHQRHVHEHGCLTQ